MSYKKSPFENAPKKRVNKTRFNLSHEHKSQMVPGMIFPCMRPIETMPGDEFEIQSQFFFRFESLYYPIMHKMTMRADTYFIPYRILWPKGTGTNVGWMDWLTKMEEVDHPRMNARMSSNNLAFEINVLAYMGIPLLQPDPTAGYDTHINNLNAFPLSAYLMIWDWYERNPQLEDERWFPLEDGDNTTAFETAYDIAAGFTFPLLSSKWEKDYFTSALPLPQVGDAIKIPLVSDQHLTDDGSQIAGPYFTALMADGGAPAAGDIKTAVGGVLQDSASAEIYLDINATAAVMRQLREAEVLQSFHERVMKIGDRYDDYIQGLYGTHPQPGTISIPVLIGSVFGKVNIADVMTTADQTSSARLKTGDYTGQANLFETGDVMRYTCHEHGVILMLVQLNANTGYGQGIDRMWRRSVQTDYPLDMFATIGDQEILKEEILFTGNTADNAAGRPQETFGYIDRFGDSKFCNDIYVGNLGKTGVGLSQHLGRWWDPLTTTGATYSSRISISGGIAAGIETGFIYSSALNPGGHRLTDVFKNLPVNGTNYPTQGTTFAWIFHSIYVNRALPLYSTPSL